LSRDGRYALHAFPHPIQKDSFNDEEFCITGRATFIENTELRQRVAQATGDDAEGGVIFELSLERAFHKSRDKGKLIHTKWKAE
jgi:hypothetical protein